MNIHTKFLGCLVALAAPLFGHASEPAELPFAVGERLQYDLKWSVFAVGSAEMVVMPMTEIDNETAWHFTFTVRTNRFADRFFKVRTRLDSWVSEDLERTLLYREKKREGKTNRDVEVVFNWRTRTAQYFNHGQAREPLALGNTPHLDPLGAVYYYRALSAANPNAQGESVFTVVDGKRSVPLRFSDRSQERIRVGAGRFDAFRVEPETGELGGVFEKSEDTEVRIWFSSDFSHYPLQVQGEVVVGSFWARLASIQKAK